MTHAEPILQPLLDRSHRLLDIRAVGQAGVPGPSFLVVAVLLAAGIPIEGLPLLFALDRIFDMIRTALNITGDAACAVIVDALIEEEATEASLKQQKA